MYPLLLINSILYVCVDHHALLPPSQVHDHLLTPNEKRRNRRKRVAQVVASASESSVPARGPESSSVPAPASESVELPSVTTESTKSSEMIQLKVSQREVSQSTSVPVSVKSVQVKLESVMSSLDNPVFMSDQVIQEVGDPTTSCPWRRRVGGPMPGGLEPFVRRPLMHLFWRILCCLLLRSRPWRSVLNNPPKSFQSQSSRLQ